MSPPTGAADPTRRWLTYGALAVVVGYLGAMLAATEGHAVPQVADLFLILQYARALAQGHPFQYNPGEPASTGATSLLFTIVLGAADAVGIRGERLVAFAIALGGACYVGCVRLAHRAAGLLGGPREALLAGLLVALCGPTVWGFLYGSDIAPFMFLFLWLTERLLAGSLRGVAVAGTLLALTRPEGLPVALVMLAWSRRVWPDERRAWLLLSSGVASGLAVLVSYRMLTGRWVSTSMIDKSLLSNYGLVPTLGFVAEYFTDVLRGLLLGFYPSNAPIGFAQGWAPFFFPPLALLLVMVAVLRADPRRRPAIEAWAVAVVAVALLVSSNMYMGVHFNRYLMWAFPTLQVLVAVGLAGLTRVLAGPDQGLERSLFRAGAVLCVVLGALSTVRFGALYGSMAGQIYRRDVAAAQWISRHLPAGVRMANLATSIEYLTGHTNLNLHGVTTPAFFGGSAAEREANVFEALGRLPAAERPEYLITTVATHAASDVMPEMVVSPPVFQTSSFDDEIVIYRMRYDMSGRNHRWLSPATMAAVQGLVLVDQINVTDVADEAAHGYRYSSRVGDLRLQGAVHVAPYARPDGGGEVKMMDGGRAIVGSESFRVCGVRAGRDLLMVQRSTATTEVNVVKPAGRSKSALSIQEAFVDVTVDGGSGQRTRYRSEPEWHEQVFRLSGATLQPPCATIGLRGRYSSFHYWFFQ
jgi:hypothetical protein